MQCKRQLPNIIILLAALHCEAHSHLLQHPSITTTFDWDVVEFWLRMISNLSNHWDCWGEHFVTNNYKQRGYMRRRLFSYNSICVLQFTPNCWACACLRSINILFCSIQNQNQIQTQVRWKHPGFGPDIRRHLFSPPRHPLPCIPWLMRYLMSIV